MKWFIYSTGPVDSWTGWMDLAGAAAEEADSWEAINPGATAQDREEAATRCRCRLERLVMGLGVGFSRAGWDGEISQGPLFTALPDPDFMVSRWMVGLKQPNNGTCYFACPFPIPWLEHDQGAPREYTTPTDDW